MAEAVVEEPNGQRRTFFCHSCSIEFNSSGETDYTCPNCFEGFIEELPADAASSPAPPQQDMSWQNFRLSDLFEQPSGSSSMSVNDSPYYRIANDLLSPIILASAGRLSGTEDAQNPAGTAVGTGAGGPNRRSRPSRRNGGGGQMNFENILQEILFSISEGAVEAGGAGGSQMVFMGNPNDYAWGREGLDTIVTQLLNQMDNSGPPPLDKDKINDIPKAEITEDQVESKLQCSVCWEDFKLTESVRKLPCLHVYHEECIIPWLELHGTCPICRKVLVPEQGSDEAAPRHNSWTSTAQAVAQHLRHTLGGGSSGSSNQPIAVDDTDEEMAELNSSAITIDSSSDNDATSPNSSTTDRNHSRFRDDEGNVEFEYD